LPRGMMSREEPSADCSGRAEEARKRTPLGSTLEPKASDLQEGPDLALQIIPKSQSAEVCGGN